MSYQDAAAYIKKQQEEGVTKNVIVENLKTAGWHDSDINKAFSGTITSSFTTAPQQSVEPKNPFAITSLILGICSVFLSIIVFIPIVGLVFGILALQKPGHRTSAIWGICLSAFGLFWIGIVGTLFLIGFLSTDATSPSRYDTHDSSYDSSNNEDYSEPYTDTY